VLLPRGYRLFHNHAQLDPTFTGRWLGRLPDSSLVYLDEYDRRLADYRAAADARRAPEPPPRHGSTRAPLEREPVVRVATLPGDV
jgi:hypothetical protein